LETWQAISPYILPTYYLGVFFVVVNILLENRNPLKTQAYLLLLLLLPFLGMIIYLFFGQYHRKRRIFSKRKLINTAFGQRYVDEHLDLTFNSELPALPTVQGHEKLIHFLNRDLSPLSNRNEVTILRNGEEKMTQLFEAIKVARSHIHMEYYIYSNDDVGAPLAELLKQKAREGVEVRLILDAVGSWSLKRKFYRELKEAGVQVHEFMPVLFPLFTSKINYRDHRKIVIIDGHTGFTGGINLDDRYVNNGKHGLYWRDTHLKIEGEAVKTLQLLFILNWQFVCGEDWLPSDTYFPEHSQAEKDFVQINASGPDWELASIMDSYFLAINQAKKSVRITTPYFIPNDSILDAITTAARSGVKVELMLPYESDSWIVQAASLSFMTQLLAAGVSVFLYQKGFLHAKVMVIDDGFSTVGTANMDYRSFDLNYEVNTYMYNPELAAELCNQFEEDKLECIQLELATWRNRPLRKKLKESLSRLLAPLL